MATAEFYYDPLECSICLGSFKDPKILPCFHSFCLVCLEKHVREDIVPASRYNVAFFTCPLCRKQTTIPAEGVKSFQTNFYIDALKANSRSKHGAETLPVHALPAELGSLELHPGLRKTGGGQEAQNQLAEMRFRAAKIVGYLSELKQDCSDYTEKFTSEATQVRKEIEKLRQKAHDLVNAACDETIHNLEGVVQGELERANGYKSEVGGLISQASAFEKNAEAGQKHENSTVVSETQKQVVDEYTKVVSAIPRMNKLGEKKSVSLKPPPQPVNEIITTQTVLGGLVIQSQSQCQAPVASSSRNQGHNSSGDANQTGASSSHGKGTSQDASSTGPDKSGATPGAAHNVAYYSAESDVDSDSSVEAEDDLDPSVHGAVGGAEAGASVLGTGQQSTSAAASQGPRVLRMFNAPVAIEIRHIAPHTTPGQAWVNYGQREPTVYLVDVNGHQIKMVTTGGDAHDMTVLDQHTLVVANPAQKRIKHVDIDPDDSPNLHGQHTYLLPFSATCIAYNASVQALAVAGKNNLQILSTVHARSERIIHGQSDFLTKPSSVAFSCFSDLVVLAVADLGTKAVYIFAECHNKDTKFSLENMFMYQGEGLGERCLGEHLAFQPVSVSGRENVFAVLDKGTESIALLGHEFSLIGIVRLSELQVPSPRSIAFTSGDSSCWKVWLGTASGQIAVIELPEFLSVG